MLVLRNYVLITSTGCALKQEKGISKALSALTFPRFDETSHKDLWRSQTVW